ncbi:RNA-directed DNA polymerase from mobile element jockey, partial [Elysia marginata]
MAIKTSIYYNPTDVEVDGFENFGVLGRSQGQALDFGGEKSKRRKIRNGVPQGLFIAPTLFNTYISDMLEKNSLQPSYADGWVLTRQSKEWTEIEDTLSKDTTALKEYFDI